MAYQDARRFQVTSPLGEDVLLFDAMDVVEELGRLSNIHLKVLSKNQQIKATDLLGQLVTIRVQLPNDSERFFNGYVARFEQTDQRQSYAKYSASLRPWAWFLTQNKNCRIFQNKSVPEIINDVFRDNQFFDFRDALTASYPTVGYCVQYRESDFAFVSRLMEQEGIYYFFKESKGKQELVLCDSGNASEKSPGYERIPYFPQKSQAKRRERDHIHEVRLLQQVQPGKCVLTDYDFEQPLADLQVAQDHQLGHTNSEFEVFDYPGMFRETSEGDRYATTRLEELHCQFEKIEGVGNAAGLRCGALFELTDCYRPDLNCEYLVVATNHIMCSNEYEAVPVENENVRTEEFRCKFTAINSRTPYRTARTTIKPAVRGPQTAVVVGPKGQEIYTDKYGRVKVQFHWDRYGQSDENSSCWIRVAQTWAGKKWGAMQIPRIGQEVLIDFLEGDADRPIIIGSVYNAAQIPHYNPEQDKTKSYVKSNSSMGGEGFNELMFDDKRDAERVFIHAQKDMDVRVRNDSKSFVGASCDIHIQKSRTEQIDGNSDLTVRQARREKVDGDMSLSVGKDQHVKVMGDIQMEAGPANEIHLKAGQKIILEAGSQLSLVGPGGFIDIGPAGVTIQGTLVKINSGGAPGTGKTCQPDEPKEPAEAHDAESGMKSARN